MKDALEVSLEGVFPPLISLRGAYAGLPELTPYKDRLYAIRDTAWDAGISTPKLDIGTTALVSRVLGEKVQEVHDIAQNRLNTLYEKTEAKLKQMGDAGQRSFYALAASNLIGRGNASNVLHQIGKAIGTRSLNFAREILQQAKGIGIITGLENGIEERFYATLGLPEVFAAVHEWEEFLAEVAVYHTYATESAKRVAAGQWATFLKDIVGLNFTDVPAFNAAISRMMGKQFNAQSLRG
jgi:hypothetical protein